MLKYRVLLSKESQRDLALIRDYVAKILTNPVAARNLLSALKTNIASLENMPKRYQCLELTNIRDVEIRIMAVENYRVFYTCDDKDLTVSIVRILYKRQDSDRVIRDST